MMTNVELVKLTETDTFTLAHGNDCVTIALIANNIPAKAGEPITLRFN